MNTRIAMIGRMTQAELARGRYMRAPDHGDIDITADLTGGADDASFGDRPYNGQSGDAQQQAPSGTQHVHGDARHVNADPAAPAQAAPAPKAEPSLREQLSSAFKGTDGKPTTEAAAQNASTPAPAATPLTKDGEGKYRNADGTFASTDQVAAFEATQNTQPPAQQSSPVLAQLTAQEAQQFQSLPAELRQYVERTMEGLNTRAARYNEYDVLESQIIGPRREAFAQQGVNPVVALNQLFALSDFAGRDPGNFAMWFAEQHNLDLDALLDARDAAKQNVDPVVQGLQQQVQQLTGTVQQFQQGQQSSVQNANYKDVETFATAKDAAGALARPYLTDVMDGWATQITAVRSANPNMPNNEILQKAYENACWADPAVRGKMQEAARATQQVSEAARVQAARTAGSSVTGAPGGEPNTLSSNPNRTLREELEANFAAASA